VSASEPSPDRYTPYKLRLRRSRRHKAGIALIALAAAMAVVHALEHLGAFTLISPHVDDLLLGWPMAILIAIVGAVIAGT
jgi:hypothetical protein